MTPKYHFIKTSQKSRREGNNEILDLWGFNIALKTSFKVEHGANHCMFSSSPYISHDL